MSFLLAIHWLKQISWLGLIVKVEESYDATVCMEREETGIFVINLADVHREESWSLELPQIPQVHSSRGPATLWSWFVLIQTPHHSCCPTCALQCPPPSTHTFAYSLQHMTPLQGLLISFDCSFLN